MLSFISNVAWLIEPVGLLSTCMVKTNRTGPTTDSCKAPMITSWHDDGVPLCRLENFQSSQQRYLDYINIFKLLNKHLCGYVLIFYENIYIIWIFTSVWEVAEEKLGLW